jgi:hypothetical protein
MRNQQHQSKQKKELLNLTRSRDLFRLRAYLQTHFLLLATCKNIFQALKVLMTFLVAII